VVPERACSGIRHEGLKSDQLLYVLSQPPTLFPSLFPTELPTTMPTENPTTVG
jgi:hypothetical protein